MRQHDAAAVELGASLLERLEIQVVLEARTAIRAFADEEMGAGNGARVDGGGTACNSTTVGFGSCNLGATPFGGTR